jgi:hypothetical protein
MHARINQTLLYAQYQGKMIVNLYTHTPWQLFPSVLSRLSHLP